MCSVPEVITKEVSDGVAVLTLNRPERLNAWTAEMQILYFDLLAGCATDDEVRAIVVTGAGKGFCAGADMGDLEALSGGGDGGGDAGADGDRDDDSLPGRGDRPQTFPLTVPKPLIAAVNGACAGLGLVHAVMCDLRFAAEGAKLTTAFVRRGLVGEYGLAWMLPRLIGPARALDLLLSGRVVLAEEAAELGLVNRVLPPDRLLDETVAYARDLAVNSSPTSMAVIKEQVYGDLERGLDEAYERALRLMGESFGRPDFAEGVASFVERREPRFAPFAG
jgi:enoyl-CoA hydratase/carnithine racemase